MTTPSNRKNFNISFDIYIDKNDTKKIFMGNLVYNTEDIKLDNHIKINDQQAYQRYLHSIDHRVENLLGSKGISSHTDFPDEVVATAMVFQNDDDIQKRNAKLIQVKKDYCNIERQIKEIENNQYEQINFNNNKNNYYFVPVPEYSNDFTSDNKPININDLMKKQTYNLEILTKSKDAIKIEYPDADFNCDDTSSVSALSVKANQPEFAEMPVAKAVPNYSPAYANLIQPKYTTASLNTGQNIKPDIVNVSSENTKKLNQEIQDMEAIKQSMQNEINNLQENNQDLQENNQDLQEENQELKKKNEEQNKNLNSIKDTMEKAKEYLANRREKSAERRAESEAFKREHGIGMTKEERQAKRQAKRQANEGQANEGQANEGEANEIQANKEPSRKIKKKKKVNDSNLTKIDTSSKTDIIEKPDSDVKAEKKDDKKSDIKSLLKILQRVISGGMNGGYIDNYVGGDNELIQKIDNEIQGINSDISNLWNKALNRIKDENKMFNHSKEDLHDTLKKWIIENIIDEKINNFNLKKIDIKTETVLNINFKEEKDLDEKSKEDAQKYGIEINIKKGDFLKKVDKFTRTTTLIDALVDADLIENTYRGSGIRMLKDLKTHTEDRYRYLYVYINNLVNGKSEPNERPSDPYTPAANIVNQKISDDDKIPTDDEEDSDDDDNEGDQGLGPDKNRNNEIIAAKQQTDDDNEGDQGLDANKNRKNEIIAAKQQTDDDKKRQQKEMDEKAKEAELRKKGINQKTMEQHNENLENDKNKRKNVDPSLFPFDAISQVNSAKTIHGYPDKPSIIETLSDKRTVAAKYRNSNKTPTKKEYDPDIMDYVYKGGRISNKVPTWSRDPNSKLIQKIDQAWDDYELGNFPKIKNYMYYAIANELIRINDLLMALNLDINVKIISLLSQKKYAEKLLEQDISLQKSGTKQYKTNEIFNLYVQCLYIEVEKDVNDKNKRKNVNDSNEELEVEKDVNDSNEEQFDINTIFSNVFKQAAENGFQEAKELTNTIKKCIKRDTEYYRTLFNIKNPNIQSPRVDNSKYIISYVFFKILFNTFFKNANINNSSDLKNLGEIKSGENLSAILHFIHQIEEKAIIILNICAYLKEEGLDINMIEPMFYDFIKDNKKVYTIAKRRHDNYKLDNNHPYFTTKIIKANELLYISIAFKNVYDNKNLFCFYENEQNEASKSMNNRVQNIKNNLTETNNEIMKLKSDIKKNVKRIQESRNNKEKNFLRKNIQNIEEKLTGLMKQKTEQENNNKLTLSRSNPYASLGITSTAKKPFYFTSNNNNIARLNDNPNEFYTFGPFDSIFNDVETSNSKVANEVKSTLDDDLGSGKNVIFIGYGQSGSGKTSTLIQLNRGQGDPEDGVLALYLKSIYEKLEYISIECVNLYYKRINDSGKVLPVKSYDDFKPIYNYKTEIYNWSQDTNNYLNNYQTTDLLKGIIKEKPYYQNVESNFVKTQTVNSAADINTVCNDILKLFSARQINPTSNNEKSSRSHIVVCLTLKYNGNNNTRKLVVCDLAGVENVFECNNDFEIIKFDSQYETLRKAAFKEKPDQEALVAYKQLFGQADQDDISELGVNSKNTIEKPFNKYNNDMLNSILNNNSISYEKKLEEYNKLVGQAAEKYLSTTFITFKNKVATHNTIHNSKISDILNGTKQCIISKWLIYLYIKKIFFNNVDKSKCEEYIKELKKHQTTVANIYNDKDNDNSTKLNEVYELLNKIKNIYKDDEIFNNNYDLSEDSVKDGFNDENEDEIKTLFEYIDIFGFRKGTVFDSKWEYYWGPYSLFGPGDVLGQNLNPLLYSNNVDYKPLPQLDNPYKFSISKKNLEHPGLLPHAPIDKVKFGNTYSKTFNKNSNYSLFLLLKVYHAIIKGDLNDASEQAEQQAEQQAIIDKEAAEKDAEKRAEKRAEAEEKRKKAAEDQKKKKEEEQVKLKEFKKKKEEERKKAAEGTQKKSKKKKGKKGGTLKNREPLELSLKEISGGGSSKEEIIYAIIKIIKSSHDVVKGKEITFNQFFSIEEEITEIDKIIKEIDISPEAENSANIPDSNRYLNKRIKFIRDQCEIRKEEGYMINRSLYELNKGMSLISKESVSTGNLPIYFEKYIYPDSRFELLEDFTLDEYYDDLNVLENDWESQLNKYGVLLSICSKYFGIDDFKDKFKLYTLLVYNTSLFAEPKQSKYGDDNASNEEKMRLHSTFPTNDNVGYKNNPPNPPYVNLDILKYFTRINFDDLNKTRKVIENQMVVIKKYPFYQEMFKKSNLNYIKELEKEQTLKQLQGGTYEGIKNALNYTEALIELIEKNNSTTFIGTFENTDSLQTISFNHIGSSSFGYSDMCNTYVNGSNTKWGKGYEKEQNIQIWKATKTEKHISIIDNIYNSYQKYHMDENLFENNTELEWYNNIFSMSDYRFKRNLMKYFLLETMNNNEMGKNEFTSVGDYLNFKDNNNNIIDGVIINKNDKNLYVMDIDSRAMFEGLNKSNIIGRSDTNKNYCNKKTQNNISRASTIGQQPTQTQNNISRSSITGRKPRQTQNNTRQSRQKQKGDDLLDKLVDRQMGTYRKTGKLPRRGGRKKINKTLKNIIN